MAKKVWSRVHNKLPSGDLHVEIYCRILSNSPQGNLLRQTRQACSSHHQIVMWICFWSNKYWGGNEGKRGGSYVFFNLVQRVMIWTTCWLFPDLKYRVNLEKLFTLSLMKLVPSLPVIVPNKVAHKLKFGKVSVLAQISRNVKHRLKRRKNKDVGTRCHHKKI